MSLPTSWGSPPCGGACERPRRHQPALLPRLGRAALVNRIIRLQKVLNEQQRAVDWLHKELHEQQQAAYSKGWDEAMKEARHGL
jgi:hypothetical protein